DSDLVIPEVIIIENLADNALALDGLMRDGVLLGEGACLTIAEVAEDFGKVADVIRVFLLIRWITDATAFVAEAFFHLHPELAGVDELPLAFARFFLSVGEHPQVGENPGVIEELLGQSHDRLKPIVLDNPLTDVAFTAARVAGEKRRTIEYDGNAAASFLW